MLDVHTKQKLWKKYKEMDAQQAKRVFRTPKPYDPWNTHKDKPRSLPWIMRGVQSCEKCGGKGYVWFNHRPTFQRKEMRPNKEGKMEEVKVPYYGEDIFGWESCSKCKHPYMKEGDSPWLKYAKKGALIS